MSTSSTTQEELDNKKRKVAIDTNSTKTTIISHFNIEPKTLQSPPILKKSIYIRNTKPGETVDLQDPVCFGLSVTYLYLIVDIPPDRDYIERYRIVLTRLFSSIRLADPNATII